MSYTERIDVLDLLIETLRQHEEKLDELVTRLEELTEVNKRMSEMKAMPTDWLESIIIDGVEYRVDLNYNVWDMSKEEKIYHETGAGEIDLRDVLIAAVTWDDEERFTFRDFMTEVILAK